MSKQEFTDCLRAALNGRISPNLVTENVNYYEDYINAEIRKGRTEAEVLQSLGDPRLIARTIIETNDKNNRTEYQNAGYQSSDYRNTAYQNGGAADAYGRTTKKKFRLPVWAWIIIIFVLLVVVFSVVVSILSFLTPVIMTLVVVALCVKLFRDWLN